MYTILENVGNIRPSSMVMCISGSIMLCRSGILYIMDGRALSFVPDNHQTVVED